ncbi:transmembrane protease serine 9-like isoform X2 [Anoplophora glabripennis]|uniref:transmembrane protease serine 9-like isoform X2 n=1 Tax=Anoplophora glabripennis TaxID=217634 RepID=UPI000C76221B|nr:transmembrane protease serine 9-like isoform X2 [Anoplophora glabripennis]
MALGMLIFVVFSALFSFSYAANIRIVNGTDAREGEFPYAASLRHTARHVCGATILDERHALTAAHCVCEERWPLDPTFYSIQYGSIHISETFQRSVQVAKIYCNNFNVVRLTYDAAVLVLAQPLSRDYPWQPVTLYRDFDTRVGHRGVIIGWGRIWHNGPIPSVLQKLEVEIYPDSICGRLFEITQHVCFGAPIGGACNGDSGTSLMVEGKQVAIASFITTTCGTANTTHPNVYSKITASLDFIDNILNSS